MIDIVHAIPRDNQPNGEVVFSIKDYTVEGPQKALQSLIVELLSDNSLTRRARLPFITELRRNNVRNLATLANIYAKYIRQVLRDIDDPARPKDERILSSKLVGFTSITPDTASLAIQVTSRENKKFTYTFPVRI